ncbi:MAG: flagellar basal body P-ring formation chaperone FlgA [Magnetococcus sp. DMHC-1]|nr:flagellar basal body P-ring formation protein FlgA [Magnetococcales bacterium]
MFKPAHIGGTLLMALSLFWNGDLLARQVERQVLTSLVEKELAAELTQRGEGFVASRVYCRTGLEIDEEKPTPADSSLSVQVDLPQSGLEPGRRELAVTVLENGVPKGQVRTQVVIHQEKPILVLQRPLQRGEVVRKEDLETKELTLTRPVFGIFGAEQMDKVAGMMAKRALPAGVPLQMNWFEFPMAVDRGDRVQVHLNQGGLNIETSGVAMAKGRIGEAIEIQNPNSRRRFLARVTGPGHVEVMSP